MNNIIDFNNRSDNEIFYDSTKLREAFAQAVFAEFFHSMKI